MYRRLERMWVEALKRCLGLPEDEVPWPRLESLMQGGQSYGFSDGIEAAYRDFLVSRGAGGPAQPLSP